MRISNTGLVFKICKKCLQLGNKTNQPISKMGKRLEWALHSRKYTNDQKAHEKMSNVISCQQHAN